MFISPLLLSAILSLPTVLAGKIPALPIGRTPDSPHIFREEIQGPSKGGATTPGKLRLTENSGICETTPGVYQASGYGDITPTKSIWFWFFAARKNPSTAPVALWFNGGPGSSSMIGLFQEHGPCRINNDTQSVSHNPYSWNNDVNMLYIDQPVGVGFSHGDLDVSTSQGAAADIWSFLQIFFKDGRFSKYQPNDLAIWTESYGGHYGPAFSVHILKQNAAIAAGKVHGVKLNLQVLGIGNGLTDALSQYKGYLTYAAKNPYHPLVNASVIEEATKAWNGPEGCESKITACYNGGSNATCADADDFCNEFITSALMGDYNFYYIPTYFPDSYPPAFSTYLDSIRNVIGAEVPYTENSLNVSLNFYAAGDWMRNFRPDLETVINSGVRTIIYDGDADYISNFDGVEAMVDALNTRFSPAYRREPWSIYTVQGQKAGQYKSSGTFSYLRVYGAGHEVPAYKYGNLEYGQTAAQMFTQIMSKQSLVST